MVLAVFAASLRNKMQLALPAIALAGVFAASTPAAAFSLDDVTTRARSMADQPYVAPVSNLPPAFSKMQFADYIKIQPKLDAVEWKDQPTPYRLGFYHQGMHFSTPVKINEIVGRNVQEIRYSPSRFDFGDLKLDKAATNNLGYAGFRVLYPLNRPDKLDEVMSILGASYFRVIGKGQVYGLSARGLAIDTGLPVAEEFPAFREFWIERPHGAGQAAGVLRADGFPARHGRLPLRADAGHGRDAEGPGARVHARRGDQARHCAADQHVPVRPEPAARRQQLPPGAA